MWDFNLVVTMAPEGRYSHLLEELSLYGEFHRTEFLGVAIGKVADVDNFLEILRDRRDRQLFAFRDVGRVIPVDRVFTFHPEDFLDRVRDAIAPYLDLLAGQGFYVRLERRGLKGRIISPEAERAVDAYIEEELSRRGKSACIRFDEPDAIVAVETIGDRCGVGLLTRERMARFQFVRVG
jgi:tRNA(Ser,Leu) C12 N-acetylase TAN1